MALFDNIKRSDSSPPKNSEDSFTFLNRRSGEAWDEIRATLNAWFAKYPAEHASDLKGRFRSKHPGAHQSAWWELYLHHLLLRLGYEITVHPEVPETTQQPDFELSRNDERFYLEAAVVFSGIVEEGRDETREGWIKDAVNRGTSPNFYVGLEFERIGTQRPKDAHVFRPVEQWLETLDPDRATADYERTGAFPIKRVSIADWELLFEAFPIKVDARGQDTPGRLLGLEQGTAGMVDDVEQLRDTLKHKRGRYGTLEIPLVVAVNSTSPFMENRDVANALFGSSAIQYQPGPGGGSTKPIRQRNGTWLGPKGPTGRRMSAILSATQASPTSIAQTPLDLWLNPRALQPFETDWPFQRWTSSDVGHVACDPREINMADLLGLPEGWPGSYAAGS